MRITGYGKVGIGTKDPSAALDVRGDVKLGADGSMYASASGENLCIVRGTVTSNGQKASGADKGFTVEHDLNSGAYYIKFEKQFKGIPSASVSQIFKDTNRTPYYIGDTRDNAIVVQIDASQIEIATGGNDGVPKDRGFTFVVIGQRN